jgi:hypothetical protein
MLRVTAENREQRHRDYHEFFKSSMNGVPGFPQKRYVFVPGDDRHRLSAFVDKLLAHGIEVERATEAFASQRASDYFGRGPEPHRFPAGSVLVSLAQPLSRLANAVLEREPFHSQPFFYDVSVWALPYNYGVEGYWTEDAVAVRTEPVKAVPESKGTVHGGKAQVAYAWSYTGNQEARAAFQLAADGFKVYVCTRPFRQAGVSFAPAAIVAFVAENDEGLHARVPRLAEETGIDIYALQSGHAEEGSDLGGATFIPITRPSVAVLTRDGVDSTAFGSFWFLFDQLYGLDFTPITIEQLKEANLKRYSTIILPDGGVQYARFGTSGKPYQDYFGDEGAEKLKRWVQDGGTLIAIKGGTEWAAAEAGLVRVESLGRTAQTPGAIVEVKVKRSTPLTVGFPDEFYVLSRNTRLFRARSPQASVISFGGTDLKIAGYLTDADRDKMMGTDYLMVERIGGGRAILFGEEPNLRCQWPVLHRLLFNAILLGRAAN